MRPLWHPASLLSHLSVLGESWHQVNYRLKSDRFILYIRRENSTETVAMRDHTVRTLTIQSCLFWLASCKLTIQPLNNHSSPADVKSNQVWLKLRHLCVKNCKISALWAGTSCWGSDWNMSWGWSQRWRSSFSSPIVHLASWWVDSCRKHCTCSLSFLWSLSKSFQTQHIPFYILQDIFTVF